MTERESDTTEVQFAHVEIDLEIPVDKGASEQERRGAIYKALHHSGVGGGATVRYPREIRLDRTESLEEAAERHAAEAEARAEAKAQQRYERHLDNRGAFRFR